MAVRAGANDSDVEDLLREIDDLNDGEASSVGEEALRKQIQSGQVAVAAELASGDAVVQLLADDGGDSDGDSSSSSASTSSGSLCAEETPAPGRQGSAKVLLDDAVADREEGVECDGNSSESASSGRLEVLLGLHESEEPDAPHGLHVKSPDLGEAARLREDQELATHPAGNGATQEANEANAFAQGRTVSARRVQGSNASGSVDVRALGGLAGTSCSSSTSSSSDSDDDAVHAAHSGNDKTQSTVAKELSSHQDQVEPAPTADEAAEVLEESADGSCGEDTGTAAAGKHPSGSSCSANDDFECCHGDSKNDMAAAQLTPVRDPEHSQDLHLVETHELPMREDLKLPPLLPEGHSQPENKVADLASCDMKVANAEGDYSVTDSDAVLGVGSGSCVNDFRGENGGGYCLTRSSSFGGSRSNHSEDISTAAQEPSLLQDRDLVHDWYESPPQQAVRNGTLFEGRGLRPDCSEATAATVAADLPVADTLGSRNGDDYCDGVSTGDRTGHPGNVEDGSSSSCGRDEVQEPPALQDQAEELRQSSTIDQTPPPTPAMYDEQLSPQSHQHEHPHRDQETTAAERAESLERRLVELEGRLESAESEAAVQQELHMQLKEAGKSQQQRTAAVEEERDSLAARLAELEESVERKLRVHQRQLEQVKSLADAATEERDQLQKELCEAQAEQAKRQRLQQQLEALRRRSEAGEEAQEALLAKLAVAEEAAERQELRLQEARQDAAAMAAERDALLALQPQIERSADPPEAAAEELPPLAHKTC
eukprot:TRINITY_DN16557_c0_g1_i1.p1 TRINITY_DN16557_c0_g1~~TRINITY_DN16557_c0_g1_i1.p1  ORF type:complete len:772 (-),score=176.35 TRINITY_DN16557_c0_g1_i1:77-2392(-)